jgi:hypothetical protein
MREGKEMRKNNETSNCLLGLAMLVGTIIGMAGCTQDDPTVPEPGDQIIPTIDGECAVWDDGNLDGWAANTVQTSVSVMEDGGETGGFLRSTSPSGGWGIVGAVGLEPEFSGDFIAKGYTRMTVSLQFSTGDYSSAVFRVRYLDSRYNGWFIPLACDLLSTGWQKVSVEFQPDWSDEDAESAGWIQESRSASFSETMANVYHAGIRCQGAGSLVMGIDNFCLVIDDS